MDMQQPQYQPPYEPPQQDKKGFAIAALVLGILSLCAWLFPICGFPIAIAGVILGILGLKSSSRTLAIVGLVLSGLALLLSLCNAVAGGVMSVTNPDLFNNIINSL
jgi:hypothetical protein